MKWFGWRAKPDWQHPDAARRQASIATSAAPDLRAALPSIARDDPDPGVRLAAIERIDDRALLDGLRRTERDADVRVGIDRRLAAIARDAETGPDGDGHAWLAGLDAGLRAELARTARHVGWRRAALDGLDRPALLAERCLADPDPSLRLELVTRIEMPETLDRIAREARRKDKRLARAASERALALRIAAGEAAAIEAAIHGLCERLSSLVREPPEALPAGLAECESRWAELAPKADARLAARVEGHLERVRASLARARGESSPSDASTAGTPSRDHAALAVSGVDATADDADRPRDEALATLERLVAACAERRDELDAETLEGLTAGFEAAWQTLREAGPAAEALRHRFEALSRDVRARHARAREAALAERRAREADAADALESLEAALEALDLAAARAAASRLDGIRAAGEVLPDALARRERAARHRLRERLGHQRWSLNRQRAALCEAAENLIGSGLHPDAVASRVRELRASWARLDGIAEASGQPAEPDSGLARRFRAVTAKALAPTRRYFEERERQRAARAQAFEALAAATDEATLDDRELALRRRALANALRELDGIERARRPEIARRLREALARVDAVRVARADEAASARRRLIASTGRRLVRIGLSEALAVAREAEAAWARLPRARPDVDRGLRAELDALLAPWRERERTQREASSARLAEMRESADRIIAGLESLAASGCSASEVDQRLASLTREWQALARDVRPPGDAADGRAGQPDGETRGAPRIRLPVERFEAALERARAAVRAARAAEAAAERERRRSQADAVRRLEALALARATGVEIATDRAPDAPNFDGSTLPGGLAGRRDAALAVLEGRAAIEPWLASAAAAAEAARVLAVHAECCAGLDSPPTDAEIRRRVQVERLERRLRGGRPVDPEAELAEIEASWLALGPLAPAVVEAIGSRIERAVRHLAPGRAN
jgi:hypothetical protein